MKNFEAGEILMGQKAAKQTLSHQRHIPIPTHRIDVKANMEKAFDTAIGTYEKRKRDAFSLAFWIETIVFFPTKLGSYLGTSKEGTFMKIMQLIYWLISAGIPLYKFVIRGI